MHRSSVVYKQNQSKTNMSVYFDVGGQQRRDFSLEEVLLRIMDSSKLKHLNNVFVYYKHTVVL